MTSIKCSACGLVNFASAAECKKCGAELGHQTPATPNSAGSRTISLMSAGGLPGWLKVTLIFFKACTVCGLSIYWFKQFMSEGDYPVIYFLPLALVGYIAGMISTNVVNIVYKKLNPKPSN
jgi:hypothetical protein